MPATRQPYTSAPLPPAAFLILVSLAAEPSHGYQLKKDLLERSDGSIDLDPGSLYRLIFKLGEDGLIEAAAPHEPDAGQRRVYQLTRVGRGVLKAETARLAGMVEQARAISAPRNRRTRDA
jgi:DNA-binding PadR family transcriptional regulator